MDRADLNLGAVDALEQSFFSLGTALPPVHTECRNSVRVRV